MKIKSSQISDPASALKTGTRMFLSAVALAATTSFAADYYVAPGGSNTNAGTLAQPFLTIQKAASVMAAGDTCYIRAGTYRETVSPANSGTAASHITFRAYGSETVTVSGADVMTGWSVHTGGIYKAAFTGALGDKDQVFVDGTMMNIARWPNTSLDVSRPTKAYADTGSYVTNKNADGTYTATYTDDALIQPAGFFDGAKIHFLTGPVWVAQTSTATNYVPGAVEFRLKLAGSTYVPKAGNPYFFFGLLSLLDAPGEWFIDSVANRLYLWPPQNDSPANHTVEAKRRDFGFDLSGRAYINVQGLRLFACAVNTSGASHHLALDGLDCKYVSHFSLIDTAGMWDYHMEDTGLILKGTNNVLCNSHIAFSAGNGVTVLGLSNRIDNCVIHDVDYSDLDCAAINAGKAVSFSRGHEICSNTCYNSGRGLILIRGLTVGKVHHNVLYRSMLRTTDGGAIYTFGHDGQNTEISFNRMSDNVCGGYAAAGIYLDGNSTNLIAHHNLIYNSSWALHYNPNSINIKWFNNTAVAFSYSLWGGYSNGGQAGSEVRNNLFNAAVTNYTEAAVSNNLNGNTAPLFVSTNGLDFRVQSDSPAIDAGLTLPHYTDGYSGTAPDIGAFEYGQAPWTAGSALAAAPPAGPTELAAAFTSNGVFLTWKNNTVSERPLVLDRSLDNKDFTELVFLPANSTNYTDCTVQKRFTCYYRVRVGESPDSNYQSVSVAGHDPYGTIQAESLDAQSGLNVTASDIGSCDNKDWAKYSSIDFGSGATNISLRVANGQTLTNLYLEVRLDSTNGTRVANINVLGTGGWGTWSNIVSAISISSGVHDLFLVFKGGSGVCNLDKFSFGSVSPLSAPVSQSVAATPFLHNRIRVSWDPVSAGQDGFKVERATDNQNFVEIGTASAVTNAFVDSGLPGGAIRYYRVRSYNRQGFSDYSAVVSATNPVAVGTVMTVADNSSANAPYHILCVATR